MAGLDPAIRSLPIEHRAPRHEQSCVDGRVKPGHDAKSRDIA
jgi:hypothetical protein